MALSVPTFYTFTISPAPSSGSATGVVTTPAAPVDYVADWKGRLTSRLYMQFRNKVTWGLWIVLLARQFQDLEDSGQTLTSLLDIDALAGIQLDILGVIVGQPRIGVDDPTYRLYLRARAASNRSTGTPEDLYVVFRALLGVATGFIVTTCPIGVKAFTLRAKTPITRQQALVGVSFLHDAKEAGARGLFEWQESATALLFTYDGTTAQGYDAGVYAGASQA
jgi:hypothetical protein